MGEPRTQTFTHSSPIGQWSVSVWRTDPRLAEIVTSMWFGEGQVSYQRDRILPSGQSQLLINLGPPQYRIEPGPPEVRVPFVDVWYSGLHQGPIDTEAPHGNALLGVAFSARGTFPWLGARMNDFSDRIIALADALGDGALRLRERLLNTPSLEARFTWDALGQAPLPILSPKEAAQIVPVIHTRDRPPFSQHTWLDTNASTESAPPTRLHRGRRTREMARPCRRNCLPSASPLR